MKRSNVLFAAACAIVFPGMTPALGQTTGPRDHLICHHIKDSLKPARYTANLNGFTFQPGCTIRTPAQLACEGTAMWDVRPAPPGKGPELPPDNIIPSFLCYKAKCPVKRFPPNGTRDQFGTRGFRVFEATMVCAPATGAASPGGAFLDSATP